MALYLSIGVEAGGGNHIFHFASIAIQSAIVVFSTLEIIIIEVQTPSIRPFRGCENAAGNKIRQTWERPFGGTS